MYFSLILILVASLDGHQASAAPRNRTRIRINAKEDQLPEITLGAVGVVNNPDCDYRILQGGPQGSQVNNATVGEEVYHEITCKGKSTKSDEAYCLMVFNCTVSSEDKAISYAMIDEYGCTLEPLLFEDVEYEADLKAGIRAQAIRFHGSPKVSLHCQTRLLVKGQAKCDERRPKCIKNEYFLGSALKVNTPPR